MTFKNFLDLRKKDRPKVIIVEKTVTQPRSWKIETLKTLLVITIVSVSVWGISNADDITENIQETLQIVTGEKTVETNTNNAFGEGSFATVGIVETIDDSSLTLNPAKGPKGEQGYTLLLDISNVKKIETNTYDPITITDVQVGDKIVVQGRKESDVMLVGRIINFSDRYPDTGDRFVIEPDLDYTPVEAIATTTVATSTEDVATTEETASTTATTTDESSGGIIDTVTNAIGDVVDAVQNTIESVADAVTGNNSEEETNTEPSPTPEEPTQPEQDSAPNEPAPEAPVEEPQPEPESSPEPEPESSPEPASETPSE